MATSMETFNWDQMPLKSASTADPAAGADPVAVTVPAGKKWLLLAVRVQLVTDANAADRFSTLTITNGTTAFAVTAQTNAHTASLTRQHYFFGGAGAAITSGTGFITYIPPNGIELAAGYVFQITFTNLQVGDNATAVLYVYKEVLV